MGCEADAYTKPKPVPVLIDAGTDLGFGYRSQTFQSPVISSKNNFVKGFDPTSEIWYDKR